jgi:hypothetical protein
MLFGLIGRSETNRLKTGTYALADGAMHVLDVARRERMVLANIAALKEPTRPQHWFAANMLTIVVVNGRRPDADAPQPLTKELCEGLTLNDAMNELRPAAESRPSFVDLTVSKHEIERYLNWARAVQ